MKLFDPHLPTLTPAHVALYWRYQVIRTMVDFGAAVAFVIGSVFFFFMRLDLAADWMFLIGSILFAVKPTIDVVRAAHLRHLPGQSDGPTHHAPVATT